MTTPDVHPEATDRRHYRDFREYLDALEVAGKLRRVTREIDKDAELHPLVRWQFRGLPETQRMGFLFENVIDIAGRRYDVPVACSVTAPSREVYGIALRCRPDEISSRWLAAYRQPIEPRLVSSGPCQEVIHEGASLLEHDGLLEFPIPMATNGWEGLPRLTALCWHTRDPESGAMNVGIYNGTLIGPLRTSCRNHSGHLATHWRKCRDLGIPLQAAAVVGAVPAVAMVAATKVPYGQNELAVAGGLAGEPIDVVRCRTVDLVVPASAEVVIEGEIPTNYTEPDPASGESSGYLAINWRVFSMRITAITHRRNPIWHDFISQMPPSESSTLRSVALEGTMLSFLRRDCGIPQVRAVAFHHCAAAAKLCVIQLDSAGGGRTHTATVWHALQAALSKSADWPKIAIAVDDDIDPWDLESVLWAASYRYQPARDTRIVPGRLAIMDQSTGPSTLPQVERDFPSNYTTPMGASSILLDCTRKWPYTPTSLPTRPYMERAKQIWEEIGLPPLTPRMPWFGSNLGLWPEPYRRQAGLASEGQFDAVATEILAGGSDEVDF